MYNQTEIQPRMKYMGAFLLILQFMVWLLEMSCETAFLLKPFFVNNILKISLKALKVIIIRIWISIEQSYSEDCFFHRSYTSETLLGIFLYAQWNKSYRAQRSKAWGPNTKMHRVYWSWKDGWWNREASLLKFI